MSKAKLTHNEDQEKVFNSTISGYKGQITIRTPLMGSCAASAGPVMFLGRKLKHDDSGRTVLSHEHGHYLDYKQLGFFRFFLGIGLPSMINASRKPGKRPFDHYYNQPWEIRADILAKIDRNEHTGEAIALSEAYHEHLKSIKGRNWFKFLFKDLRNFINHDFTALYN